MLFCLDGSFIILKTNGLKIKLQVITSIKIFKRANYECTYFYKPR